ncbi:MAG: recombinase [Desulfobacteraceae bacterium]|nr:recombinase [Desulfobacteraceae bacterium]
MGEYEDFEAECNKIRKENKTLLKDFAGYLKGKKLSKKTIDTHVDNIDFFINEYLLYDDTDRPEEGVNLVSSFLGYWFIRKAMWASETAIKSYIASLKHFYTWMHGQGKVTGEELDDMKLTIKEEKQDWIDTLNRYDDPDCDVEDVWGV